MEILAKVNKPYKSIGTCEFRLPEYCVLTGKNGSGKSHILQAMTLQKDPILQNRIINTPNIHINGELLKSEEIQLIQFGGFNPNIKEKSDPNKISNFIKQSFALYNQKHRTSGNIHYAQQESTYDNFIKYVMQERGKNLQESDFWSLFDLRFLSNEHILNGEFALIFKTYAQHLEQNEYNRYRKDNGYHINEKIFSNTEFIQSYGEAPWKLINDIFERVHIPYKVNDPIGDHRNSDFNLQLIDKQNNDITIKFEDLSTGEKVLMSLAMTIYNSDTNLKKPKLLLLDEPDAGLHPSMSRNMVSVLREFIVDKLRIPVVMVTHSPTTIAALEGVEIFEKIRNINEPKKTTKEAALNLLTADIPFLTVTTEARRDVLVESHYDADNFTELYNIFKNEIDCKPHFFPCKEKNGDGSNCSDVIHLADKLFKPENNHVYGIIDRDELKHKRVTKDNLLILGDGERYAIENYILDPLLIGVLLVIDSKTEKFTTLKDIKIPQIKDIQVKDAQAISDEILKNIEIPLADLHSCEYVGGMKLNLPHLLLETKGHDLEDKYYKTKIACLKKYHNPNDLKFTVIQKVIKNYPEFLPKAVLNTLMQLK